MPFDPLVFGHRLRHHRKARGLTLEELGERVGRPAPYLSLLENGKREPKLTQIAAIADALDVASDDLLRDEAPNRRAELEIAFARIREHPRYARLDLPEFSPSARVPDEALEHIVAMFEALDSRQQSASAGQLRSAVADTGRWLADRGGHLDDVERVAADILATSGYEGTGAVTSKHLNAITTALGWTVDAVDDIPGHLRTVVVADERRILVAQRNALRTRQARKAILQTLAGDLLGHQVGADAFELQRNRLESAYFAAAVLIPESAAAAALRSAKADRDLTIEDIKERFYVSYEMAAQRFTNLATHHLDLPTHFIRSDGDGIVWKAYSNDGFPIPRAGGAAEGRRLCRHLPGRTVWDSEDRFDLHTQFTDTPAGSFWSATHVTPGPESHAVTTGVRYADARWFRHRNARHHTASTCPAPSCCARPDGPSRRIEAARRMQAHLVTVLSGETPPLPEPSELGEIVERHPDQERSGGPGDPGYPDPWATHVEDEG